MNLKRKLTEMKDIISTGTVRIKNYESSEKLENRLYRFHYVNCYLEFDKTSWPLQTFKLPLKMTEQDAFKVISYITDFVEKTYHMANSSFNLVIEVDKLLEQFLFKRDNNKSKEIIDLFVIEGKVSYFKNSDEYKRYVEWYYSNITFEKVLKIYQKLGLNLEFNPNNLNKTSKI